MQLKSFVICFLALVFLASCSSTRKTSITPVGARSTAKRTNAPGKREFLDGIEVTPGLVVSSDNKSSKNSGKSKPVIAAAGDRGQGTGDRKPILAYFNIEKASMLQLKYAVITDALVEKLTNIPLLEVIDKWWGTKYCMGGSTDNCLDCSAFTQIIMRDVYQLALPRTSQEQFSATEKVELEDLREGDLVFFNTAGRDISHVGVYLLNNKFAHASTSGGVMISDLNEKYWQPKFKGAGRVKN
jgi:hypothetical protein